MQSNFINNFSEKVKNIQLSSSLEKINMVKDIYQTYSLEILLRELEKLDSVNKQLLAKYFYGIDFPEKYITEIKNLGIFYYRVFNGGIERLISLHAHLFSEMGYNITLFLEERDLEKEYNIPENVKIIEIPKDYKSNRANVWQEELNKNNIDILIYHASSGGLFLEDVILLRSLGIKVIAMEHSNKLAPLVSPHLLAYRDNTQIMRLCHGVVVLDTSSEWFYKQIGVNAFYIPNSVPKIDNLIINKNKEDIIIWVGRIDSAKNYYDALDIMREVLEKKPQAKAFIIGKADAKKHQRYITRYIKAYRLKGKLIWQDYLSDVSEYYKKAKVFLFTSIMEGWGMVLAESKLYGIPLVMMDLPYLELTKNQQGTIVIPPHNIQAGVHAVSNILQDENLYNKLSEEAYNSVRCFAEYNQQVAWQNVFQATLNDKRNHLSKNEQNALLFWETLVQNYREGKYRRDLSRKILRTIKLYKQSVLTLFRFKD